MKKHLPFLTMAFAALFLVSCAGTKNQNKEPQQIESNTSAGGQTFEISFQAGKAFNHPTFSFWLEQMDESYIQTLFVTKSLATGIYGHGDKGGGEWKREAGEARRPSTLPYWLHKRGIKAPDNTYLPTPENPVPDAYTGATPNQNFVLTVKADEKLTGKFRLLMEINQTWDFNNFWTNSKYPNDKNYKASCQPSLIYAVTIDTNNPQEAYYLNPIGHGHYAGQNGKLYTDLSTFTTALQIAKSVKIKLVK